MDHASTPERRWEADAYRAGVSRLALEEVFSRLVWVVADGAEVVEAPETAASVVSAAMTQSGMVRLERVAVNGVVIGSHGVYGIEGDVAGQRVRFYVVDVDGACVIVASETP